MEQISTTVYGVYGHDLFNGRDRFASDSPEHKNILERMSSGELTPMITVVHNLTNKERLGSFI